MSPSEQKPDHPEEAAVPDVEQSPACGGDASDASESRLLEEVLRHTLESLDANRSSDDEQLGELLEVAKRLTGEPLSLEPVGRELVDVLLKGGFPRLRQFPELRDQMSRDIARSLLEDPDQKALLTRFWTFLGERAA